MIIDSYRWLYTSVKWLYRISRYDVPCLPIYYEHLAFDTESQIRRIHRFLGVSQQSGVALPQASVHELYGSATMRTDPRKLSRVVYDADWLAMPQFVLLGPVLMLPALFSSLYARHTSSRFEQAARGSEDV